ncbi:MAG: nicotinic acid mononucleotide adenylyltransferase [Cellvibrionaceae bacterium]|nr:nicotinic acid mononucleotide adenylyltransferase [Cellvibrionaceae bacterium]|tara:strand:- start:60486 stop:61163 length:678 start_codon:yes stop_codon:yes gene_type:complete
MAELNTSPVSDHLGSRLVIGLFGGTFDPVHNAHLRMALELKQRLQLDEMRLLPCHQPPHRDQPQRSSDDRAAMVRLAVEHCDQLSVDERELQRDKPSYTVDTLLELRQQLGDGVSLCWCVGMDSLVNLSSWHRWRELLDVGHLVVTARPGWQLPVDGEVADWLNEHRADAAQLKKTACGSVVVCEMSQLAISATEIRDTIAKGDSAQYLMPEAVWRYIKGNDLYN